MTSMKFNNTELIQIINNKIGDEKIPTVNARELHYFLGNKAHFTDWIKKRISDYDFQENIDFVKIELQAGQKLLPTEQLYNKNVISQKNEALESSTYDSSYCYPYQAIQEFRDWFNNIYLKQILKKYLDDKLKRDERKQKKNRMTLEEKEEILRAFMLLESPK